MVPRQKLIKKNQAQKTLNRCNPHEERGKFGIIKKKKFQKKKDSSGTTSGKKGKSTAKPSDKA